MARPSYLDPDVPTVYCDDETGEVVNELGAPTGTIAYFSLASAPDGWIKANGATISRTTYDKLFTAIGTTYGAGDGSTTFVLPDLRGEFVRGLDDGRGVDTGRSLSTSQSDAIRNITGSVYTSHSLGLFADGGSGAIRRAGTIRGSTGGGGGAYYAEGHDFDASRQVPTASENRPRNMALLACIKY